MGCCVSSNKTSTSPPSSSPRKFHDPPKHLTSLEKPSESNNREIEKETVKEVLSETPKWTPTTIAKSKPQKPRQNTNFNKFKEEGKVEKKALSVYKAEDTSEVCSLSETMSTTTSITDQKEEREESRKRVDRSQAKLQKNRSFPSDNGGRRERTVHGSRNEGSVRLVQCRDQMGQKMGHEVTRRRRDPGENSFRRSRSPATDVDAGAARSVLGRSPSARRTNRSSARVKTTPPANGCRKMENPVNKGKRPSGSESLENPLVSLECFIFI